MLTRRSILRLINSSAGALNRQHGPKQNILCMHTMRPSAGSLVQLLQDIKRSVTTQVYLLSSLQSPPPRPPTSLLSLTPLPIINQPDDGLHTHRKTRDCHLILFIPSLLTLSCTFRGCSLQEGGQCWRLRGDILHSSQSQSALRYRSRSILPFTDHQCCLGNSS